MDGASQATKKERVLAATRRIIDLEGRKAQIDLDLAALHAEVDTLLAESAPPPAVVRAAPAVAAPTAILAPATEQTLGEQLEAFLAANPGPHDIGAITAAVRGNADSVRKTLSDLAVTNRIERADRGIYKAIPGLTGKRSTAGGGR